MPNKKNILSRRIHFCVVVILSVLLILPALVYSEVKQYYYLQVGSFKIEQNAIHLGKRLRDLNKNAVVRRVETSDKKFWYPVYVGPFSTWQEADQQSLQLRKAGLFVEKGIIHKKTALISSNLKEKTEIKKEVLAAAEKKDETVHRPQDTPPANGKDAGRSAVSPTLKEPPGKKPEVKQLQAIPESKPASVAQTAPDLTPEPLSEPLKETVHKGFGRNVGKNKLSLKLKHTYIEYQKELTKRIKTVSDGTTITSTEVPLDSISTKNFNTSIHTDTLRFQYGLTHYLDVFADIGVAYDEITDIKFIYGAGGRLNIFTVNGFGQGKYYGAVEGEYLAGEIEEEYTSKAGNKWNVEADWQTFSARLEFGVVFSKLTPYVGGSYLLYRDDAKRHLLENIPSPYTLFQYDEELSEENNFGIFGGFVYHFSPALSIELEGQFINQNSISGSLGYQF